ncbi:MAG: DUF4058 family protein [Chitinophagaceae bacterium]|nr:DUF4058 family protein [Anaerolineae bacterium]
MKPVRSVKNQYLGINAHLHSFWQATGTWNRFHNAYITHLMESLKARLRLMGYTAEMEESLQIRRIGDESSRRPKSDVIIYDLVFQRPKKPFTAEAIAQGLTVEELIEEEDFEHPYFAIGIYERLPNFEQGDAVAWIEVLSPTNKGNSPDANRYLAKRHLLLERGLVFVEIDYLHELPPTFHLIKDYSNQADGSLDAHPYHIVVLDPRPDFRRGPARIYDFDVDMSVPIVNIPLNGDDALLFDFGLPYHQMIEQGFHGDDIDYAEFPMNFDRYSPADQTRIANRMLTILEAEKAQGELENGPFPVQAISLEAALAQIETLKKEAVEK